MVISLLTACAYKTKPKSGAAVPKFANHEVAHANATNQNPKPPDYNKYKNLKKPPLSPQEALETFNLEEGFRIELVAHEPTIVNPVAMDIDADGRLWVVEMRSYMPVHDKSAKETSRLEQIPESRIVVLEDTSGDGQIDNHWVFMDKLVLPRSIKVLDDGVLLAEPPNTWFIQDTTGDGVGDTKELVYNHYGDPDSDNVEHMDNGLMWGMDNWIHSVYSDVSLRRVNGGWKTRPFEQMTQWGITQDDWGQLYTSHNSRTLISHLVPFSYSHRHPKFSLERGINSSIAESETMWPAHATGVNRGYRINEIVREDGTLKRSTATCGPVIYRGNQFGDEYRGNAFVPEPAGNLIKRLVNINGNPSAIDAEAQFAYEGREFLTSTDERFRPVNMYNGPDGAIYLVDMYQGIFQHAHYLTDHLRDYAVEHGLHKPTGDSQFGRIYRIVKEDQPINYDTPELTGLPPAQIVEHLSHKNGILRDAAQQLLVQRSPQEVIPELEHLAQDQQQAFYTRLQALWSLEGYDSKHYKKDRLYEIAMNSLQDPHPRIRASAVRILEEGIRTNPKISSRLIEMADNESAPYTQLQLLATLGVSDNMETNQAMAAILDRNFNNAYFHEMFLTGVHGKEADLLEILEVNFSWKGTTNEDKKKVLKLLRDAENSSTTSRPELAGEQLRLYNLGEQQFRNCMACHGNQGRGIEGVAPSLSGSEWVNHDDPRALTRILLHGYSNNETDYPGVMPSHSYLTDEEIAAILTYIRKSWENSAPPVPIEKVSEIRKATRERDGEWSKQTLQTLQN